MFHYYHMSTQPIFQDRIDAGLALCQHLQHYKNADAVVLAVPRGGLPVALPVARILQLPLELILSKKIGHPMHKEFAIGAVSLTGQVISPTAFASDEYIQQETLLIREQLRAMYEKFMGNKQPTPIKGKVVIIIDDGVATGHTFLSTLEMIKKDGPKKMVIAVPVASKQAAQKLSEVVDEFVCIWIPSQFRAVGEFYADFAQVSDEDVITMLSSPE